MSRSTRAFASKAGPVDPAMDARNQVSEREARSRSRFGRFFDSDIVYSFLRSKVTVAAALVTLAIVLAAFLAPLIAPHDPFDLREVSLLDSHMPPAWAAAAEPRVL